MFQSGEFSLREYLELFVRRRWMVLGVALLGLVAGLIPPTFDDPVYVSTSTIRLKSDAEASPFDDAEQNVSVRTRELVTDQLVIRSAETRALVIEQLGPDAEPFSSVEPTLVGVSELIDIRVSAPTASAAANAANAYADVYIDLVREASVEALELQASELRNRANEARERQVEIDQSLLDEELEGGERASLEAERATLAFQVSDFSSRADQLEVEVALRQQLYTVVSRARVDFSPLSPSPFRSGLIGTVLGFLVGLCLAVLLELLQDRVSSPAALDAVDDELSVLAAVPHASIDLDNPGMPAPRPMREALRYLRNALRVSSIDHPFSSVLVSSSLAAEGKTTTAVYLARSLAEDGRRVVLVDADTRRPSVHDRVGISNDAGLSDVLAGRAAVSDVVQYVEPTLAILPAGPPSDDSSELLRTFQFERLVDSLSEQADLVIVDTPPVLPVADALEVSRAVDAALVVARIDRIRRRDLQAALRRFREARVRVLGLVANDFSTESGYGYGDYFSYGSSDGESDRTREVAPAGQPSETHA